MSRETIDLEFLSRELDVASALLEKDLERFAKSDEMIRIVGFILIVMLPIFMTLAVLSKAHIGEGVRTDLLSTLGLLTVMFVTMSLIYRSLIETRMERRVARRVLETKVVLAEGVSRRAIVVIDKIATDSDASAIVQLKATRLQDLIGEAKRCLHSKSRFF